MKQLDLFNETPEFEERRVDGLPGEHVWFLDPKVSKRNTTWLHMKAIKGIRRTENTTWTKEGKVVKDVLVIQWEGGGSTDINSTLKRVPKDRAIQTIEDIFSTGHAGDRDQGRYDTMLATIRMKNDPIIFSR